MVAVFISYQHHFIRFSTCSALSLIFFKSFFISCPFMTSMESPRTHRETFSPFLPENRITESGCWLIVPSYTTNIAGVRILVSCFVTGS